MPTAVRQSPKRSDENLVVTAIAVFLVAALILGTVAYRYFKHSQQQQEQTRSERQAYKRYNDYLDSTEQATAKPAANPPSPVQASTPAAAPSMAEKLLSHPAVTPGPGFNAPGVQRFTHWLDQRASVPLIQALHRQADDWRDLELARARKLLAHGAPVEEVLQALSHGLTQKMLHGPLAELHAADGMQREQAAQTISRLFLRGNLRTAGGIGSDSGLMPFDDTRGDS